jgi:hypothetical protein
VVQLVERVDEVPPAARRDYRTRKGAHTTSRNANPSQSPADVRACPVLSATVNRLSGGMTVVFQPPDRRSS